MKITKYSFTLLPHSLIFYSYLLAQIHAALSDGFTGDAAAQPNTPEYEAMKAAITSEAQAEDSDWLNWDEIMIAEQLASLHWGMVKELPPREILRWGIIKKKVCLSMTMYISISISIYIKHIYLLTYIYIHI
tara:strand:- start:65 stop:460 length:396 start_codon:yes stop_codon:yes gene_type:complete